METVWRLKVSSDRLVKTGIEPATPGLQVERHEEGSGFLLPSPSSNSIESIIKLIHVIDEGSDKKTSLAHLPEYLSLKLIASSCM